MIEIISARERPCGCGCGGSDPWHRPYYRRVVRDVQQVSLCPTRQVGYVQLPMSTQLVQVRRQGWYGEKCQRIVWHFWEVVPNSIVYDK